MRKTTENIDVSNIKCYLCGKKQLSLVRNKVRYDIPRKVVECESCGLNYLIPKELDLENYYSEEYRKKHSPILGEIVEPKTIFDLYLPIQKIRVDKLKQILNPQMKVLDVGCSTGHFLYTLKDHVGECIGIELNPEHAEFTEKELGIKTYNTAIENTDIPMEYFDLITFYQVLEHIDDPIKFLNTYKKYLKKDGYICIEVPNIDDILISAYKVEPYIDFWFREPHLFNFSQKSLAMLLEKVGFKGKIEGIHFYNFLNHLNWIFTGKPQKSVDMGRSKPVLIKNSSINENLKNEINQWFENVNKDYMKLLEKHFISESMYFIGHKI
ncbi:MAG: class I SAM-dependent methyltransferase [Promethearchaeota archaeon]